MQSAGLSFPASQAVLGTTQFPTSSMRTVPTVPQRRGTETGFRLPDRSEDGGARRGGHLFRNEPGHKLPVSGHRVPQDREHVLYKRQFCDSIRDPGRIRFPAGFTGPQGTEYGSLRTGDINNNDLGTTAARDANIYQWNLGDPAANYPARSCWAWTTPQTEAPICPGLAQTTGISSVGSAGPDFTAAVTPTDPTCLADSCVSNFLQTSVGNPFYSMFNTPCTSTPSNPCFNEPNSNYGGATLPVGNSAEQVSAIQRRL
jgi:hypothetical protein